MIFKVAKPESLAAVLEMLQVETQFPKFGNQISIGDTPLPDIYAVTKQTPGFGGYRVIPSIKSPI